MEYTYTSNLENEIWTMAEELDESGDCESVISFLNSKDSFQPFGARLAEFIAKKLNLATTDRKTITASLTEQCEKNGVDLSEIGSDGTLRNWFEKDKRPKKGTASRRSMFALAFALNYSVDETKDLFHKIYLDRAFNYRDEKEIIYYFCLKNGKSWTDAARLIANADGLSKDYSDHTQYTQAISSSVDSFQAEQDLLDYIRQNGHNFEKNSLTAKTKLEYYLSEAKKFAKEEIQYSNERDYYRGKWTTMEAWQDHASYIFACLYKIFSNFNWKRSDNALYCINRLYEMLAGEERVIGFTYNDYDTTIISRIKDVLRTEKVSPLIKVKIYIILITWSCYWTRIPLFTEDKPYQQKNAENSKRLFGWAIAEMKSNNIISFALSLIKRRSF